jgi:hypothetical protein
VAGSRLDGVEPHAVAIAAGEDAKAIVPPGAARCTKKRQSSCIRSIGSQSVSAFSLRFDCVLFVMRDEPISEASIPTGNQRENLSSFPDFRSSIGRLLFGGIIENVPESRAHVTDRYQPAA